jgi:hypothetical protein
MKLVFLLLTCLVGVSFQQQRIYGPQRALSYAQPGYFYPAELYETDPYTFAGLISEDGTPNEAGQLVSGRTGFMGNFFNNYRTGYGTTITTFAYSIFTTTATTASVQVCIPGSLFSNNVNGVTCGRRRRDDLYRKEIELAEELISASRVQMLEPTVSVDSESLVQSRQDLNYQNQNGNNFIPNQIQNLQQLQDQSNLQSVSPDIASSQIIGLNGNNGQFFQTQPSGFPFFFNRGTFIRTIVSTLTSYFFTPAIVKKPLMIATVQSQLLCIPAGFVIC